MRYPAKKIKWSKGYTHYGRMFVRLAKYKKMNTAIQLVLS
jgi:hypothetical protein